MTKNCPLLKTMGHFENDSNLTDLFTFNEFSEDIEYIKTPEWEKKIITGKVLDNEDITEIRYYISRAHNFEPPKHITGEACYLISKRNSHHPVKEYIESIIWDGVNRLDEWLIKSAGCDDNIYIRMASSKFLIAAVNRIYNPGCKFDHMIILEGDQRIGKSTLVEIMAGVWFLDTNFGNKDKDLIDSLRGSMLIEIAELDGMNKKDVAWLKGFLSRKVDRVRLPYAARSKDFKRKCVFIGTYNPSGNNMYLRDDTGNARFWPIECKKKIDFNYLHKNKDQIWAEAYDRYLKGEKYYIDDNNALEILNDTHQDRELESPTFYMIRKWLKSKSDFVLMEDVMQDCLKINMNGKIPKDLLSASTTIGIIMKKLKWCKGTKDNRDRYYAPEDHGKGLWDEA